MPEIPEVADLAGECQLLRNGAAGHWLDRDFVEVTGPEAGKFLQGQVSQDVLALAVGESAWSWVLQPQGKVEALVRVTRVAADTLLLDTDGGWGEALMARLNRFKLRVKADISLLDWRCLAVRGPVAAAAVTGGGGALAVDTGWPGWPGTDLLGADVHWPTGLPAVGAEAFEVSRIEAGVPRMGTELTERTIPAETDLVDRTVSFTKGCYTGQELVARIDSRGGHVPRHLRGIVLARAAPAGADVVVGDKRVGTLTSVARRPGGDAVGLAYIRRDVDPPADARVTWPDGPTAARIERLPLAP